ncbi:MAG: PKD domain-containing protein [Isosphaeraceae bacterium]|nr:PKD domain-containing protein [Isosphaeraceae bacterium]
MRMRREATGAGRPVRVLTVLALTVAATALLAQAWVLAAGRSWASGGDQGPRRAADRTPPPEGASERLAAEGAAEPAPLVVPARPKAVASFEGTAAPGLLITLKAEGANGPGLSVRWVQIQGPPVTLEHPETPEPRVLIPEGATTLGFLLIVANAGGIDVAPLTIPVQESPGGGGSGAGHALRADAGDDQIGLVGRQVTLSGLRSEPRDRIGYRWVQTGGPEVRWKLESGPVLSFVPPVPGRYRFALVVASGSAISEPDTVTVAVGAGQTPGLEPSPVLLESPQDLARMALASIPGGPEVAEGLAQALILTADRMDLYRTYNDAFHEMARRLDNYLPIDPTRRGLWNDQLFVPLTGKLIEELRVEGLDLRTAEGRAAPLTTAQRARLAEILRSMAEGFRAAARRSP